MKAECTILLMLLLLTTNSYGDPYVFPITPESPEWSELTIEERLEVQQIPDSLLLSMSTEDLYLTFLTLPGRYEYHLSSHSSTQLSFERWLLKRYNILPELLARYDIADLLNGQYRSFFIDETNCQDFEYQHGRIGLTTMLLFQYTVIARTTPDERRALAEQALTFYRLKEQHPDWSIEASKACALLGRIMAVDGFLPLLQRAEDDPDVQQNLDYANSSAVFVELAPLYLGTPTAREDDSAAPGMRMSPCPNPFNAHTTITYTLPAPAPVILSVFSITGQKVATLTDESMSAGTHTVVFDGSGLSSGLYFARLEVDGMVQTQKMLLVK